MKRRAQTTDRHKITIMAKLADILETEQKTFDIFLKNVYTFLKKML